MTIKKPHKHAELIKAWVDGAEIEGTTLGGKNWVLATYNRNPFSHPNQLWRIKPPEVAQWRKDMAQALDDGKVVEHKYGDWKKTLRTSEDFLNIDVSFDDAEYYRIRPEKKPDVVTYCAIPLARGLTYFGFAMCDKQDDIDNLKLIWDGETGELKDAYVIK